MARIIVVGGGFGGCASAVRLAKLGHDVTLVEAGDRIGGALGTVEHEGYLWQSGPTHTLLPAVIRDLYVKSGRKVEREFDLVPAGPQRHHFSDGTVLDLPGGSRAEQRRAIDEALGTGVGDQWLTWVGEYADVWASMRRDWFERPYDPRTASSATQALLGSRASLSGAARRLHDPHLRELAVGESIREGHRPERTPAWWGLQHYLRQTFDTWTVPVEQGGMARLADSLTQRLATRGVEVVTGVEVTDLAVQQGTCVGVVTAAAVTLADAVVVTIDPRRLPHLARFVRKTKAVTPPNLTHLGLSDPGLALPIETVWHGDPQIVIRTAGSAPGGQLAITLSWRSSTRKGGRPVDVLRTLADRGLDLQPHVRVRVDRSPQAQVTAWGGSPWGVAWDGPATLRRRLGTLTPIKGALCAGAHTTPGAGLHLVGLSAALVAHVLGPS